MRAYKYDMRDAQEAGHTEHPQIEIKRFAPDACRWQPQSLGDCWLFAAATIDPMPSFIRDLCPGKSDAYSMSYLGWHAGGPKPAEEETK